MAKIIIKRWASSVVEVPLTPNFIKVDKVMIPISDLSDNDLREIADKWTRDLILKARGRRENKNIK